MTPILKDNFETKLGVIQTSIESDFNNVVMCVGGYTKTQGHKIHFQVFEIKNEWLNNKAMKIESSRGYRYHIEKIGEAVENLHIYCKLINPTKDTSFGGATGEFLDAIEIENATDVIYIGTEDSELMRARAEVSDWMPERFKNKLNLSYSFTEFIDYGFKTIVPHLKLGEKIYFHFLIAMNTVKQSADYPGELDISTWFAVDQHKQFLDKALQA